MLKFNTDSAYVMKFTQKYIFRIHEIFEYVVIKH